ncbi:carbohydrate kinase family protein [Patescibacteria group bacterium]|nr:carbohydrate kinase family protein [Patescibacteria group bacterium]
MAYALKRLGGQPILVGAVGDDGGSYLEHLKQNGIDTTSIIAVPTAHTASAFMITDRDDNQISAFHNGAISHIPPLPEGRFFLAIISPSTRETMREHLRVCRERKLSAVFDPGQRVATFSRSELREAIELADFVIGNDYEISQLAKGSGWSEAKMSGRLTALITTLGNRGSRIVAGHETVQVPACPAVKTVDPTGAGDCFRAGFFVGLSRNLDWLSCARIGSLAATYAVESAGTQNYRFTIDQFADRYRRVYGLSLNW